MRVIAGIAKGRKLQMKASLPVRPTGDKVKGAVFSMLAPLIPDGRFLDLFAGSGAMGIEAWSRGAARVVFVEQDRRVYSELQANLRSVGFDGANCLQADFAVALERLRGEQFDVIFVDPPYRAGFYLPVMERVASGQLLSDVGVLCLEHPREWRVAESGGWQMRRQKTYGDTVITILSQC